MREGRRIKLVPGFVGFLVTITACVAAGYGLLSRFELPGLWQVVFSFWGGAAIFSLLASILHAVGRHSRRESYDMRQHSALLDAMERIAQGDFSVFVQTDDHIHAELADAINNMAKNLGNLETMRQDFISNVSHEIQSPLTSIHGFAVLLKKPGLSDDERQRYADIIETESKRLSSLSDNLLKLSSLDNNPITKREFRLDKQLSNVILTLEPQWSAKNLTVEADLQRCVASGDQDLLSQVWVNLLVNAIKFTPEGGVIFIAMNEGSVKIADTGVGISKDDLPHIFERFYKVDKARDRALGGNGLGLSLVRKIVELHGGDITVESEPGKGTVFTIRLS
jgi:two-component system phosphate regulon sensor histidine kinase PhoR